MPRMIKVILAVGVLLTIFGVFLVVYNVFDSMKYTETWDSLKVENSGKNYSDNLSDGYPTAFKNYLDHCIEPNTILPQTVFLELQGSVKFHNQDKWTSYEAEQIISSPIGFLYKAKVSGGTFIRFHSKEKSYSKFKLFGVIPVSDSDDILTQNKNQFLHIISMFLFPSSFLMESNLRIEEKETIELIFASKENPHRASIRIDKNGVLKSVYILSEKSKDQYELIVEEEKRYNGFMIPYKYQMKHLRENKVVEEHNITIKNYSTY
jgi:hypothetical protein